VGVAVLIWPRPIDRRRWLRCLAATCWPRVSHRSSQLSLSTHHRPVRVLLFISGRTVDRPSAWSPSATFRQRRRGVAANPMDSASDSSSKVSLRPCLAISHKELPETWLVHLRRGADCQSPARWCSCGPISSIVVLAIVAGVWLVVIGTTQNCVGIEGARSTAKKVEQRCRTVDVQRRRPDSLFGRAEVR